MPDPTPFAVGIIVGVEGRRWRRSTMNDYDLMEQLRNEALREYSFHLSVLDW